MKKTLSLCLALILMLTTFAALAEESKPFSLSALKDYANNFLTGGFGSTSFFSETTGSGESWAYSILNFNAAKKVAFEKYEGEVSFTYGLFGTDNEGYPFLTMEWEGNEKWTVRKADILVDNSIYTVTFSKDKDLSHTTGNREDGYTYFTLVYFGPAGVNFLDDLKKTSGSMTFRIYYKNKAYFEVEYEGFTGSPNQYDKFYEGLYASHYFDENGNVPKGIEATLKNVGKKGSLGKVVLNERTDKLWPIVTPMPTPLENIARETIAEYKAIKVGAKNDLIPEISQRLLELGYMKKAVTGTKYPESMGTAVKAFQKDHGLKQSTTISPECQALLFSEHAMEKATPTPKPTKAPKVTATPYVEDAVPLTQTKTADWGKANGVQWAKPEVKNTSKSRAITSVTFIYYCMDKDDNLIYPQGSTEKFQTATIEKKVGAGRTVLLPKMNLTGYTGVKYLHFAIQSVTFEDGSTAAVPERDYLYGLIKY